MHAWVSNLKRASRQKSDRGLNGKGIHPKGFRNERVGVFHCPLMQGHRLPLENLFHAIGYCGQAAIANRSPQRHVGFCLFPRTTDPGVTTARFLIGDRFISQRPVDRVADSLRCFPEAESLRPGDR
jgi:hypothetical protein